MRWAGVLLFVSALLGCEAFRPAPAEVHAPHRVTGTAAATPAPTRPLAAPVVPQPPGEVLRTAAKQVAPEDPLALVAKCLERGDVSGAAAHLESYVRAHPDQPLFRFQLAELYGRCDRPADARFHYEWFVAEAEGPALRPHVVTGHIKLMGLAQRAGDRYAELLHRGAGLLLLVKEQDGAKDRDPHFCEEMTCKALKALTEAKELKPSDPRARAFLADALDRAGSRHAATVERAAARNDAVGEGRKALE